MCVAPSASSSSQQGGNFMSQLVRGMFGSKAVNINGDPNSFMYVKSSDSRGTIGPSPSYGTQPRKQAG